MKFLRMFDKKSKSYKICILGGYGYYNAGDEAILNSLIMGLKECFNSPEIIVFSRNPKSIEEIHGVKSIFYSTSVRIIRLLFLFRFRKIATIFKTFSQSHLFIIGGGSLLVDNRGKKILFDIALTIFIAKILGNKIALVGISAGPILTKTGALLIKYIVNSAHLILFRDEISIRELDKWNIKNDNSHVTVDPVFIHSINAQKRRKRLKVNFPPKFGISIREWHFVSDLNERHRDNEILIDHMVSLANFLIKKYKAHLYFIPMQLKLYHDDIMRGKLSDIEITEMVIKKIGCRNNIYFFDSTLETNGLLNLFGEIDFVIGERLHSLIFAAINHIPMIAINYYPKIKGFMEMLDLEHFTIDLKKIYSRKHILKDSQIIIEDLVKNRERISLTLQNFTFHAAVQAKKNFELLKNLFLQN